MAKALKEIMGDLEIVSNRPADVQAQSSDPVLGISQYFDAVNIAKEATGAEKAIHVEKLKADLTVEFWADGLYIVIDDTKQTVIVTRDFDPDKAIA